METVARQQKEIKRFSEQLNALKRRGTQVASVRTFPGGMTIFTHCEAFGRTVPHRKQSCYFDPRKMTDRKEWARKLMYEKGVMCKDDE